MVRPSYERLARFSSPQFPEGHDPNAGANVNRIDARLWGGPHLHVLPKEDESADSSPLGEMLRSFDFEGSSDDEVATCAALLFETLRSEVSALSASPYTASLVQRDVLAQSDLGSCVASLLSSKVCQGQRLGQRAEGALCDAMRRELKRPEVLRAMVSDLLKVLVVDPAADGVMQPCLLFKGFHALAVHRVAHALWAGDRDGPDGADAASDRAAALMLQSRCSELFGVDIHPAATIGNGVMLDHATGIVIGSTAKVGSDVYLLHGVTLGATGRPVPAGAKRHPTIGSRCVLGAGSTVLGDIAVGDGCTIGATAVVTRDVPEGATVVGVNKLLERDAESSAKEEEDYTWMYAI